MQKEELAALDNVKIEKTPDVPKEKLFDLIIAPYKGKVIVVDSWNTWCRPCRSALAMNEPLKTGELKSDEIVWIYIANETSPLVKYKSMVNDIKGVHYRFNEEQWQYVAKELFAIDGIPSYVLVEKDGSYRLSNGFRNHDVMKNTLLKKISGSR